MLVETLSRNWEDSLQKVAKKSQPINSLTPEHEQHIQQIVEKDSQLCADDIIVSRKLQFEDLKIPKSQINHYLRNNMLISIKKPTFDPMTRNYDNNLQAAKQKKRKLAGGKEQRAGDIIIEEPTIEYVENNKPVTKGTTTAHLVRFINGLLDIMNLDEKPYG